MTLSEAQNRIQLLEDNLRRIAEYGSLYVKPAEWDYRGMGGGPELDDCEEVDLAGIVSEVFP